MGKRKAKDRWPELCNRVAIDDGRPCRDVGAWTEDKLYTWNRYIEITSVAMGGVDKWPGGIVYVDLFGGPGVCRVGTKRIPGSPLLAAWAPKPFGRILICEKDTDLARTCNDRLAIAGAAARSTVFTGDCNEVIADVRAGIPNGALTLAFVDPEGLHIHFESLRTLTENCKVDLAILFADGMDIVRNVQLYFGQQNSNLDRFLGPNCNWRDEWMNLPNQDAEHTRQLFGDLYKLQLAKHLGYIEFRDQVYSSARSVLYRVIYASKHTLGGRFWEKISQIRRSGQRNLPFGD